MHRMTRHAITSVLVAIVFGVAAQAAETKYGAGVSIATATPITIGVNDENDERVAREGSMAGT